MARCARVAVGIDAGKRLDPEGTVSSWFLSVSFQVAAMCVPRYIADQQIPLFHRASLLAFSQPAASPDPR